MNAFESQLCQYRFYENQLFDDYKESYYSPLSDFFLFLYNLLFNENDSQLCQYQFYENELFDDYKEIYHSPLSKNILLFYAIYFLMKIIVYFFIINF